MKVDMTDLASMQTRKHICSLRQGLTFLQAVLCQALASKLSFMVCHYYAELSTVCTCSVPPYSDACLRSLSFLGLLREGLKGAAKFRLEGDGGLQCKACNSPIFRLKLQAQPFGRLV